jgi:hypothetical protein
MSDEQILAQARAQWRAAMERDETFAARDRERRLARARQARDAPVGSSDLLQRHAIPALTFLVAVMWATARGNSLALPQAPEPRVLAVLTPASADAEPVGAARAQAGDSPTVRTTRRSSRPLLATAPCFGCRRAGSDASSVAAGERLVPGERVQVPAGSTLLLCWAIGADAGDQIAIDGPAAVVVTATGAVEREEVAEPASAASTTRRQTAIAEAPETEWRAAQAALAARDRTRAEHHLRALLGLAAPSGLRERAAFALAELELARGDTDAALPRLRALQASTDAELAADALFLEARTTTSPAERAALYARFLAGDPPSPYRERAAVDEAFALLEAGDVSGAKARAAALRARGHLPGIAADALERLERALAATPPER